MKRSIEQEETAGGDQHRSKHPAGGGSANEEAIPDEGGGATEGDCHRPNGVIARSGQYRPVIRQ